MLTNREMVNFQNMDSAIFLYALTIKCVTTGARELDGISLTWLGPMIESMKGFA